MIKMLKQIKYALLDIKGSKRVSILFLIQMIIVFLLVCSTITDCRRVLSGINRLDKLKNSKAYINEDGTSNAKIDALIADEINSVPKLKILYNYIVENNNIEKYTKFEYQTPYSINGKTIIESTANKMFFDFYDIKVIEGSNFEDSDFNNDTEVIPILVGYNLKEKYKLGEIYTEKDSATSKDVKYKVIGVLENNSYYPSLIDIGRNLDLNYTFFRPLNINSMNSFSSMDMAISSTVVFSEDEKLLQSIEKKSVDLELFSMNYTSIQDRVYDFLGPFKKKMEYQVFIAVIVLIFAGISMVLNLTTMISKKMREFSIHLICGGTINSIVYRILWQVIISLIISLIPTIIVFKFTINVLYTILVACICLMLIMYIPYVKIKKTNIVELVRRSE